MLLTVHRASREGIHMPSTLLDARTITRRHGDRTVLDAVEFRVTARARICLVGANGAGKSTLTAGRLLDRRTAALAGGDLRAAGRTRIPWSAG
jgi:ATPase subunit of ABC transporter with duplicated ATPase domains